MSIAFQVDLSIPHGRAIAEKFEEKLRIVFQTATRESAVNI